MEQKIIATDKAPAAIGPYVQGIDLGSLVFCSGQIPINPETGNMPESIEEQTAQSLRNVTAILAEAGLTLKNVIKTTVFLQHMTEFARMNEIYAQFFGDHLPARSAVEVAKLPKDALVEIEVIAAR